MTAEELDTSIAEGDSKLSAEDLAIKQQVEADTNVFSGNNGIDVSEPEYPLTPEQQATVNSTKLVPQDDGEGYQVSETYEASTPYGKLANEKGVEAADNFYAPISAQAIKDGYTAEEVEAKIGVQKYHEDRDTIHANNKNEVDTIVASNSEYNSSFTQMAQDLTDEERLTYNTAKTIDQLETQGYVLDPTTGKMTKDGMEYDLEGSFAKTMEAHQAQVMFGILGSMTGAIAGPGTAVAVGAMGAYVGEIVDNVKLKGVVEKGNESVTDEPDTIGSVAKDVLAANSQAAIVAAEDVLAGKAIELVFTAVGKGWRHFSAPTKTLIQDLKSGNINTAFDAVTKASTKTTEEIVDGAIDVLSVTKGGDSLIAEVDQVTLKKIANGEILTPDDIASLPTDIKRAVVNREIMINPDLKAELNNVLSDPDAIKKMASLIRQHTEAMKSHFKDSGMSAVIDDVDKGITFKTKLDKSMDDTLDLLDIAGANLSTATKNNKLNPFGLTDISQKIQSILPRLADEVDDLMGMVGADLRTKRLLTKVQEKSANLSDMSSLLDFRKAYNELLRQLKIYDNVPYDKTMRGRKVNTGAKADKDIALQIKEDIDALVKQTVEESPMTAEDKKALLKNWGDTNTLANEVYTTRATDLYKSIATATKDGTDIADAILKSIGSQGGDYASIMAHLSPEQAVKFDENLIMRAVEKATDFDSGLIDYRTLAKRLQGLSNNTANEATRNTVELVSTYARLFGSDADIYKSLTNMQSPGGFSRGLATTWQGFMKYTGISLVKHFMQLNYRAGSKFIGSVAPITKKIPNIPIVGKYAGKINKTIADFAESDAIKTAAIEAMNRAGSVQEFVVIAKEADILPVKLMSQISKAADELTKAHQDVGLSVDRRNAEVDMWVHKKQQADQAEFEAKEARQKTEDAFIKENTPSTIQSAEAKAKGAAEGRANTQVTEPETVADTVARNREAGGGAGYVPDSNRIPSQLDTDKIVIDGQGNPVSNAGDSKGWGADRNVNVNQRTAEQDVKDSFLNAGIKDPEYAAEVVTDPKQLPPSKTIVTPQTTETAIDARLKKARDMSPKDAFDTHPTQGKIPETTKKSREVASQEEWASTMSEGNIPTSSYYKEYDDYVSAGKELEPQEIAPKAVVQMRANGIEMSSMVKEILDTGLMKNKVGTKQRMSNKGGINFGNANVDNVSWGANDMTTHAVQSRLTPDMANRILAGKGRPKDYERLASDIEEYEATWGVASATDQIKSFTSGGLK